jgi:hypothetical protein
MLQNATESYGQRLRKAFCSKKFSMILELNPLVAPDISLFIWMIFSLIFIVNIAYVLNHFIKKYW